MKFSTISAIILGVAASVFADDDFLLPRPGSQYTTSDSIFFSANSLTRDDNKILKADLVDGNGNIKTINSWPASQNQGETFDFTWKVNVGAGIYRVCITELDNDNYDFENENREPESCSYTFIISGATPAAGNRKKRSIYAEIN